MIWRQKLVSRWHSFQGKLKELLRKTNGCQNEYISQNRWNLIDPSQSYKSIKVASFVDILLARRAIFAPQRTSAETSRKFLRQITVEFQTLEVYFGS